MIPFLRLFPQFRQLEADLRSERERLLSLSDELRNSRSQLDRVYSELSNERVNLRRLYERTTDWVCRVNGTRPLFDPSTEAPRPLASAHQGGSMLGRDLALRGEEKALSDLESLFQSQLASSEPSP